MNQPGCAHHWHCCVTLAAHQCDQPNRLLPCPQCGERPIAVSDIHAHHNAEDCAKAVIAAAREQSPNESDGEIVAATVAGSCLLTGELMRVKRERDEARDEARRNEHAYGLEIAANKLARERMTDLEAALREVLIPLKALQLADGHSWSPVIREQFAKAEPMALAALSPKTHTRKRDSNTVAYCCQCLDRHDHPIDGKGCYFCIKHYPEVASYDEPQSAVISSNREAAERLAIKCSACDSEENLRPMPAKSLAAILDHWMKRHAHGVVAVVDAALEGKLK